MNDDHFMKLALDLAEEALNTGDFPVGCVIVHKGIIVSSGRRSNTSDEVRNEIDHAEISALRMLEGSSSDPVRSEMVIYATMEPCLMCFSAIILSGIRRVVYAYEDVMGGGACMDRTVLTPLFMDAAMDVTPGVMRKESLALFKRFFQRPENTYWKGSLLESYTLSTE